MRIPDPKANTTTEAYLAYKAGYLEESELKPVLYEPYLHFDAWLAYWAGLTNDYPHGTGKNLAPSLDGYAYGRNGANTTYSVSENSLTVTTDRRGAGVFMSRNSATNMARCPYLFQNGYVVSVTVSATANGILRIGPDVAGVRTDIDVGPEPVRVSFETLDNNIIFYQMNEGTLEYTISDIQCERGSTATSYEDYTGEPEMLTDEEALVAYLAGVTDTYPEEIKDPYDVRIVGYLRHLASIRWPEPDYPVNNEEFYLSTMEPTHTSNPEPSADIELDTVDGNIISVEAYGDTYQQTYTGKNLMPMTASDNTTSRVNNFRISLPAGTYTISFDLSDIVLGSNQSFTIAMTISGAISGGGNYDGNISGTISSTTATHMSFTFTTTADSNASANSNIRIAQTYWDNGARAKLSNIQIEAGSADTSFEPYVGGIPAPNPEYPQDVHTVTGVQTFTISDGNGNSRTYTVDLGAIELVKIGDSQDFIYKSGDDWYVHKAIGKITYTGDSSEDWQYSSTSGGPFRIAIPNSKYYTSNNVAPLVYCDYYTPAVWNSITSYNYAVTAFNNNVLPFRNTDITSLDAWKTWLGSHNMTVYYPFATPTDTKITDATLVGQLEALANADTYNEKTYIKVTATGTNLPALLKVEAYKY